MRTRLHTSTSLLPICYPSVPSPAPCLWDDALLVFLLFAHHGVGFAGPRLPVGEYAHVVALEGVLQHLLADVPVHLLLRGVVDVLWLGDRGDAAQLTVATWVTGEG